MKQKAVVLFVVMAMTVLLSACGSGTKDALLNILNELSNIKGEGNISSGAIEEASGVITDNNWVGDDGSYLVCETDGSFKYYQTKEDLTDNYYEGTYLFFIGEKAVAYVTKDLRKYGVTKSELTGLFARNEEYDTANFVCLVLNNEACIVGGENIAEKTVTTPYYGFLLSEDEKICLDIANMNTANYHMFTNSD